MYQEVEVMEVFKTMKVACRTGIRWCTLTRIIYMWGSAHCLFLEQVEIWGAVISVTALFKKVREVASLCWCNLWIDPVLQPEQQPPHSQRLIYVGYLSAPWHTACHYCQLHYSVSYTHTYTQPCLIHYKWQYFDLQTFPPNITLLLFILNFIFHITNCVSPPDGERIPAESKKTWVIHTHTHAHTLKFNEMTPVSVQTQTDMQRDSVVDIRAESHRAGLMSNTHAVTQCDED